MGTRERGSRWRHGCCCANDCCRRRLEFSFNQKTVCVCSAGRNRVPPLRQTPRAPGRPKDPRQVGQQTLPLGSFAQWGGHVLGGYAFRRGVALHPPAARSGRGAAHPSAPARRVDFLVFLLSTKQRWCDRRARSTPPGVCACAPSRNHLLCSTRRADADFRNAACIYLGMRPTSLLGYTLPDALGRSVLSAKTAARTATHDAGASRGARRLLQSSGPQHGDGSRGSLRPLS
jgi:hypothetical protein